MTEPAALTFRQHVPGFVNDGEGAFTLQVESLDELLAHPWIARWRTYGPTYGGFDGYFWTDRQDPTLMAVYGNNTHWHVLGYVNRVPDLPEWQAQELPPTPCAHCGTLLYGVSRGLSVICGTCATARDARRRALRAIASGD